jgi:hypothetical protein
MVLSAEISLLLLHVFLKKSFFPVELNVYAVKKHMYDVCQMK